jgi:hypothetical protein
VNKALPIPVLLEPICTWIQNNIDDRLNGILLNWYDGNLKHYIGKHRDSIKNMVAGAPIITISFGEKKIFRLREWKNKETIFDFDTTNGSLFVSHLKQIKYGHMRYPGIPNILGKEFQLPFVLFTLNWLKFNNLVVSIKGIRLIFCSFVGFCRKIPKCI